MTIKFTVDQKKTKKSANLTQGERNREGAAVCA